MATHTQHPDVHEHGLADKCPRCAEIADNPVVYMDAPLFAATWRYMVAVEWGDATSYRSETERRAGLKMYALALFLERYTPIDPRELPDQLVPA